MQINIFSTKFEKLHKNKHQNCNVIMFTWSSIQYGKRTENFDHEFHIYIKDRKWDQVVLFDLKDDGFSIFSTWMIRTENFLQQKLSMQPRTTSLDKFEHKYFLCTRLVSYHKMSYNDFDSNLSNFQNTQDIVSIFSFTCRYENVHNVSDLLNVMLVRAHHCSGSCRTYHKP